MMSQGGAFIEEAYQEKPRADLYSIVKKLREMKTSHFRLLYVAEMKSAQEKELNNYFLDFQHKYEITGLLLIFNNLYVHLIEGEVDNIKLVCDDLQNQITTKSNLQHKSIYILHFCEEKSERLFDMWLCKSIAQSGSSKEIKSLPEHERYWTIYEGFMKISDKIKKDKDKGKSEFGMTIKQNASDLIPFGDELVSVMTEQEMTMKEFIDFYFVPPDVVLENEKIWPSAPDLTY